MIRLQIMMIIIVVEILFLLGGLWSIQIRRGAEFYVLSEDNRIKHIPIQAPRGAIMDRYGRILVGNQPSFDLLFIPEELKKDPQAVDELAVLLEVDSAWVWQKIHNHKGPAFMASVLYPDMPRAMMLRVEEQSLHIPGVYVSVSSQRIYTHGDFASHILGYVGEINKEELLERKDLQYVLGDSIGKNGVERTFEPYLRGEKGGRQLEVTALGRPKRELSYKDPVKGHDLMLTLDEDVQNIVEQEMATHKGAVVVMDPRNGEVLALTSKPSFDPSIFHDPLRKDERMQVLNDQQRRPLMNRAISAQYPPGSIFKILMGIAGLAEHKVDARKTFSCDGSLKVGRVFHCWLESGHGAVNLAGALRASCNLYFYQLGLALGPDTMEKYARMFGLGQKTGIDLLYEKPGFVPSVAWKQKTFRRPWYPGETVNFSIGQGYLLVTPIQLITAVNAVINGGLWQGPKVVKAIVVAGGESYDAGMGHTVNLGLSKSDVDVVKEGMRQVVNDPRGTGQRARLNNVVVSGKTGTVQVVGRESLGLVKGAIPEQLRNHAWFMGFAPLEHPELSIIIFLEHGESGGYYAAVVAHKILEKIVALPHYEHLKTAFVSKDGEQEPIVDDDFEAEIV